MTINAWSAINTKVYDGWIIRYNKGFSKRANSVIPLYKSEINIEEKLRYCDSFYKSMGQKTIFKITSHQEHHALDDTLNLNKYIKAGETIVMISNIDSSNVIKNYSIEVNNKYDNWLEDYISCLEPREANFLVLNSMLSNITSDSLWLTCKINNEAAGVVYGAIERGFLGVYCMYVKKKYRGKGCGRALMNRLFQEAHNCNVNKAYLQVVANNHIALNLYKSLGFIESYRYWYRSKKR